MIRGNTNNKSDTNNTRKEEKEKRKRISKFITKLRDAGLHDFEHRIAPLTVHKNVSSQYDDLR